MRIKAIFTVFPRKLPSGRKVYYYQCYGIKDKRQWAKSTGKDKKTEAVAYCMGLFKNGLLIPEQKTPTFADFAKGWWDLETCKYLQWRQLHDPLSKSTIDMHNGYFNNHIKDYFAKYELADITPEVIEQWFVNMSQKKEMGNVKDENRKVLKPKTINGVFGTFRLMMNEAVRKKYIKQNPCTGVKELKEEDFIRDILTYEEVKKLFPKQWKKIWGNSVIYKANLLAACTGLRIGEVLGMLGKYVFDDYIFVGGQYQKSGYKPFTKTKENRNVPIPEKMREELQELLNANGEGYLFSEDGGKTPVSVDRVRRELEKALERIGISKQERRERNITFHAWRHFLNTLLLYYNIIDSKVQSVTGHKSKKMKEHYTHFDTRKFSEVRDVQANLLTFDKPKEMKNVTEETKPVKKITKKTTKKAVKKPVKNTRKKAHSLSVC